MTENKSVVVWGQGGGHKGTLGVIFNLGGVHMPVQICHNATEWERRSRRKQGQHMKATEYAK